MGDISTKDQEIIRLKSKVAALEQMLEVYEQTTVEQFDRLDEALIEAGEQAQRLTLLNEMSRALNQTSNEAEVQAVVAQNIAKVIEADRVSLGLIISEEEQIEILALDGEKGVIPTGTKLPLAGTSVGQTVQAQRIIITSNTKESGYMDTRKLGEQGLLSTISAPLIIGDQVLGSLNIASRRLAAYDAQDERLLQQMASLVTSMLANRRLFEQTNQTLAEAEIQAQRLELLYQMGQDLNTADSEAEMFNIAAGVVTQIFASSRSSVALLDETRGHFEVLALKGNAAIPIGAKLPVENTFIGHTIHQDRILVAHDFQAEVWRDYLDIQSLVQQGLRTSMVAPLRVEGQVIGTLNVGDKEINAYPAHYESLIGQTAILLSSALESQRRLQASRGRARRERLLREITAKVRNSADVDTIMRTAAQEIGQAIGRPAFILMGNDNQLELEPGLVEKKDGHYE